MTSRIEYNNPGETGSFGLPYHYEMVSDSSRVLPFRKAINQVCRDKIVFESGTGTGILSLLAAKAGAKKVYTAESDPAVSEIAARNFENSPFGRNIRLIRKNTLDVTAEDIDNRKAEVAIAENLSTWQITEPQLQVMNHIHRHLSVPNVISLPKRVFNYVELCESQFRFEDLVEVRTHYFLFAGIKTPNIMSEKKLFGETDLRKINPTITDGDMEIRVSKRGVINSLRLTSVSEVWDNILFNGSDSLFPPVVVPLKEELKVCEGERVRVRIHYEHTGAWEDFISCIDAEK